jgi:hypothetical protein
MYLKSCIDGQCEYFKDVNEFYQYAAIVMYVNEFSKPITSFQRYRADWVPTFTAEDTNVYEEIISLPNGSEVWSTVRGVIQTQVDKSYNPSIPHATPDSLYYYLACWMTIKDVTALEPLLHEVGIHLPTDASDRRDVIETLIGKPGASSDIGGGEFRWMPPKDMRVTRAFTDSIEQGYSRWEPFFELALMRVSNLLDDAFNTFGVSFDDYVTMFRGVSKPSDYKGLWYDTDDTPITNRWIRELPASVRSTSGRQDIALSFCEQNPSCVLYVFRVAAGMKLIQPSTLVRKDHHVYAEDEYLLPRGCTYSLLRQRKEFMNGHSVHVLEVAVGPPSSDSD